MNNLQCVGNERSLVLCAHDGWKNHSCTDGQRAGVVCNIPEGKEGQLHASSYASIRCCFKIPKRQLLKKYLHPLMFILMVYTR